MTNPEVASAIKEYHELKQKIYGKAKQGRPKIYPKNNSNLELLWTQEKTAESLYISPSEVNRAIQIVLAQKEHPELAKYKKGTKILIEHKKARLNEKIKTLTPPKGLYQVYRSDISGIVWGWGNKYILFINHFLVWRVSWAILRAFLGRLNLIAIAKYDITTTKG